MKNKPSLRAAFLSWIILSAVCLFTAACKKHEQTTDNNSDCITRVIPTLVNPQLPAASLDTILKLFLANNLSSSNLEFYFLNTDTVATPSFTGIQDAVTALQFINHLPVFSSTLFFNFQNGQYLPEETAGGYTGAAPDADTAGHQTLAALRTAFLKYASSSYVEGGPLHPSPRPVTNYADACLLATLGYLDAGMVPGNNPAIPLNTSLVKVWTVTGLNGEIPLVYVRDDNGSAWGLVVAVP